MTNTKKTLLTTTAALTAVATGAVATTAHADANVAPISEAAQSTQQTAQEQLSNLKSDQTTAENQMAASNASQMSAATEQTNQQVAQLNDQLQSAQASQAAQDSAAVASEQAAITQAASQATAQENTAYSAAIAKQQAANAQALSDAAANTYTSVQKANLAGKANGEFNTAQRELESGHQAKLDSLKTAHDTQATQLQNQISANQTGTQQAHDQAVAQAKQEAQQRIDEAAGKVNSLKNTVSNDQTVVSQAHKNLNDAKNKLTNAQNALKEAQRQNSQQSGSQVSYNNFPKIRIHKMSGYADYRIDGMEDGSNPQNWKDTDPADQNRIVKTDSEGRLTDPEQQKELTIFAANIINHMRDQIGTPRVSVNQAAIDATNDYTQSFDNNFGNDTGHAIGHDHDAIYQVLSKYGFNSFDENRDDSTPWGESTTIADAKEKLWHRLFDFLTEQWSSTTMHRMSILGVLNENVKTNHPYVGFSISAGGAHIDIFDEGAHAGNDFSLTGASSTPSTVDLTSYQEAVTNAQNDVNAKTQLLKQDQDKLNADQIALNKANAALENAKSAQQHALDGISDVDGDTPAVKALKAKLAQLNDTYAANVKAENDNYNAKLSKMKADLQAKLDHIKSLPESTADLKKSLDAKLDKLTADHKAKLAQITKDADDKLAKFKADLAAKNANDPAIVKIKNQIASLQNALKTKQAQLDQQLSDLKAKNAAEYAALENKLMPKQSTEVVNGDSDQYTTDGGVTVKLPASHAHTDEVSNDTESAGITMPETVSHNTVATPDATPTTREEVKQAAKKLPQTGNESALTAVLLGTVAMVSGLGLALKKREN